MPNLPPPSRPKVFIGSSSGALELKVAGAIRDNLKKHKFTAQVWNEKPRPSKYVLEMLRAESAVCDFAIFVFWPGDTVTIDRKRLPAVRDNVLFELGLFMGELGRTRVFFVAPKGREFRVPADIGGIIWASFEVAKGMPFSEALAPACDQIRRQMGEVLQTEGRRGRVAMPMLQHFQRRIEELQDPDFLPYTFYGVGPAASKDYAGGYPFIYYLWAHGKRSRISASLEHGPGPQEAPEVEYCSVRFANADRTQPSNVALRPGGLNALDNTAETSGPDAIRHRKLRYWARLSAGPAQGDLAQVSVSLRVVDRYGTHWGWQKGDTYCVQVVESSEWKPFDIDLAGRDWRPFEADGNCRYASKSPDFSIIVAVIFELGRLQGDLRPGFGSGAVDITGFELTD